MDRIGAVTYSKVGSEQTIKVSVGDIRPRFEGSMHFFCVSSIELNESKSLVSIKWNNGAEDLIYRSSFDFVVLNDRDIRKVYEEGLVNASKLSEEVSGAVLKDRRARKIEGEDVDLWEHIL